jgi:hypothetical protein
MNHILAKYNKEKHYFSEPFPHIIIEGCLDDELYNQLEKYFPNNDIFKPKEKKENQPYWIYGNELMSVDKIWEDFIKEHLTQNFYHKAIDIISPFMKDLDPDYVENLGNDLPKCSYRLAESGRGSNPNNKKSEIVISVAAGINTPCKARSTIEPPHNDFPQKLFNSLLYMRKNDDDSFGGDLTLYEVKPSFLFTSKSDAIYEVDDKYLKSIKTIKYAKNVLVLFPQKINAVHGVTARGPTAHTRRYININMESYILKRDAFFKTPRSLPAKIKFKILKTRLVQEIKNILRPYYHALKRNR